MQLKMIFGTILLCCLLSLVRALNVTFVPAIPSIVLHKNSSHIVRGILNCTCSPTEDKPRAVSLVIINASLTATQFELGASAEISKAAQRAAKTELKVCASYTNLADCINADRALRGKFPYPLCTYDNSTGKNLYYDSTGKYHHTGTCIFRAPEVSNDGDSTSSKGKPLNEGCVAVEHLQGYIMQYFWNLRRTVLCYNDFCATPNHGIIFDGEYTSIQRLCSSGRWSPCIPKVKYVNNLRLLSNREVRFSDRLVITAYNFNFPKMLIWILQLAQDILVLAIVCIVAYLTSYAVVKWQKAWSTYR